MLRVETNDGRSHEARVQVNRGGPENPLSDDELAEKFRLNVGDRRRAEDADRIAAFALALADAPSVAELMTTVRD